jgi:hypothetical protein
MFASGQASFPALCEWPKANGASPMMERQRIEGRARQTRANGVCTGFSRLRGGRRWAVNSL